MNIKLLLSMPKTFIFNMKVFDIKTAMKMPIFVSYDTKVGNIKKGSISFDCPIRRGIVEIGLSDLNGVSVKRKQWIQIGENGRIVFKGPAYFSSGAMITVDNGTLTIGTNFVANNNFTLSCNDNITFGNNCLIGWCCDFLDTDNHTIKGSKSLKKAIKFGDHIWVGAHCSFLKGSSIGNDCIIGYNSLVNSFFEDNCLIAGTPAKIIKHNIDWE